MCNWISLITNLSFHSVSASLCSESDELDPELARLSSLGFTGCLSAVRFNSISPLKAALLHPDSPVTVTGPLAQSSCGSSSPANPHAAETTHPLSGTRKSFGTSQVSYKTGCSPASFPCVLVPSEETSRDARRKLKERRAEEMFY